MVVLVKFDILRILEEFPVLVHEEVAEADLAKGSDQDVPKSLRDLDSRLAIEDVAWKKAHADEYR